MTKTTIHRTSSFLRDIRKLKKFRSINDDLDKFEGVIRNIQKGLKGDDSRKFNVIRSLHGQKAYPTEVKIIKARMACEDLHGHPLRVVYAYWEAQAKIDLIEIYHKGDKENHDPQRISDYLSKTPLVA